MQIACPLLEEQALRSQKEGFWARTLPVEVWGGEGARKGREDPPKEKWVLWLQPTPITHPRTTSPLTDPFYADFGDIPPKKLISMVSRDFPNFLAPAPSRGKTPTPPEDIRTKKFGFGFLSLPWISRVDLWVDFESPDGSAPTSAYESPYEGRFSTLHGLPTNGPSPSCPYMDQGVGLV